MSTAERVADSFMQTAYDFKAVGAEWIHMVDLNGAVTGARVNSDIFTTVAAKSGLKVELGGGIRTLEDVDYYIERGVSRIVIGSAAISNPMLVKEAVEKYGDKIAVGIDTKNGMAAADGWVNVSGIDYIDLAKQMEAFGVKYIICTDISRDGMLSGPNIEQLKALDNAVSCNITASGGITDIGDITALKAAGLYGAICGRSIYKGTLSLKEAIAEAE